MTKNQHYVPQLYLRRFCENDVLCVYDTKDESYKTIKPNNICFENYLYETEAIGFHKSLGRYLCCNDIELIFSKYEGEYSALLKRIVSICTNENNKNALVLNSDEKKLFFQFVINMLVRNPKSMEALKINTLSEEIKSSDLYQGLEYVLNEMKIGGTESIFLAAQKKALLTYEFSDDNPLIHEISKLNFCFFLSKDDDFITSDTPVCFGTDSYIHEDITTCLYMALDPKVAVLFGNYKDSGRMRNRIVPIGNNEVVLFNKQFIINKHYTRWIIARSKSSIKRVV